MKRFKKQKLSPFALGGIKTTSIELAPEARSLTAEEFRRKLARDEQQRKEAPLKEARQKLENTLAEFAKNSAAHWRLPLSEIQALGPEAPFAYLDLNLKKFPSEDEAVAKVEARAVRAAFDSFVAALPSRGYSLSPDGILRFGSFCQCQSAGGAWLTAPGALDICFEFLVKWNCFHESELGIDQAVANPPKAELEPSLDELLRTESTETPDGRKKLLNAVANDFYTSTLWQDWQQSLYDEFGGYVMPEHVKKAAYDLFVELNLSFHRAESFNRVRRELVRKMLMPEQLLTVAEVLERKLNHAEITASEYVLKCRTYEVRGILQKARAAAGI